MGRSPGKHPLLATLNAPDLLRAIVARYWQDVPATRPEELRLRHPPAPGLTYREPCPRCGGRTYALDAPRSYRLRCVVCRQLVFPRAAPLTTEARAMLAQLIAKR
jgi:hypothetical protein